MSLQTQPTRRSNHWGQKWCVSYSENFLKTFELLFELMWRNEKFNVSPYSIDTNDTFWLFLETYVWLTTDSKQVYQLFRQLIKPWKLISLSMIFNLIATLLLIFFSHDVLLGKYSFTRRPLVKTKNFKYEHIINYHRAAFFSKSISFSKTISSCKSPFLSWKI